MQISLANDFFSKDEMRWCHIKKHSIPEGGWLHQEHAARRLPGKPEKVFATQNTAPIFRWNG